MVIFEVREILAIFGGTAVIHLCLCGVVVFALAFMYAGFRLARGGEKNGHR